MNRIPRKTAWLSLMVLGAAGLLPACGGNDTGSGGGGTGGTTTTSSGGTGGTGGDTGGATTTSPGAPDGSPCAAGEECAGGFCITQAEYGWPYGYCTGACNSLIPCESMDSVCIAFGSDPFCMKACSGAADCGPGQTCYDPGDGTATFCYANCTKDDECTGYGVCDVASGACFVPEDCTAPEDEDGDGLANCEDSDCAVACKAQVDTACGAAVAFDLNAGAATTKMGDTTNGTDLFAGICSGSANKENIFLVTNKSNKDSVVELALTAAEDLAVYVRGECATASDVACADGLGGGADPEIVDVPLAAGASFYAYVDGSSFDGQPHAGAYSLTGTLLAPQPEIEPNNDGPTPGPTTANAVNIAALPALSTGAVDQVADNDDWFVIDTTALGIKTITVETIGYGGDVCGPNGDVDTAVQIVSEAGLVVAENDDISGFTNYCSLAEAADAPAGKYYLHISTSTLCTPDPMGLDCIFKYALKINVK